MTAFAPIAFIPIALTFIAFTVASPDPPPLSLLDNNDDDTITMIVWSSFHCSCYNCFLLPLPLPSLLSPSSPSHALALPRSSLLISSDDDDDDDDDDMITPTTQLSCHRHHHCHDHLLLSPPTLCPPHGVTCCRYIPIDLLLVPIVIGNPLVYGYGYPQVQVLLRT